MIFIIMGKKYYVYKLTTNNGEIIYIGKGSGKRMFQHIYIANGNGVNRKGNPKLYNKISKILDDGGYIIPEILFESDNETECHRQEVLIISEIGLHNLCNLTLGGEGTSGYKLSDETKIKMSLAKKDKPKGPRSDETKKKISNALSGRKRVNKRTGFTHSAETKIKMSLSKKDKPKSPITEKRRLAIIEGIRKKKEIKELL